MFQEVRSLMANIKPAWQTEILKKKVLHAAAGLFLEKGYTDTTVREIAKVAGMTTSKMVYTFQSKENILCELVKYVLEGQFEKAEMMLTDIPHDKILYYAAETTLQLYMAESNEKIRDLYSAAYSMPKSSEIIQQTITEKLKDILQEQLPDLKTEDFYKLEIASGGIMRGFMTVPCSESFPMEQKVASFLETTFKIYEVPKEKIREAIAFVSQFDYPKLAQETIDSMLAYLEEQTS